MKILMTGSKEYPWGTNTKDPIPSGGIEKYVEDFATEFKKHPEYQLIIITRLFPGSNKYEVDGNVTIHRVPYFNGRLFRNPTFNLMALIKTFKIDFDIILTNGEISAFLELIPAKLKHKPIIYLSHGNSSKQSQYNFIFKAMFNVLNKIIYKHSNTTITHIDNEVKQYTNNYKIIRPGLKIDKLVKSSKKDNDELKNQLGINKNDTVITFVGRMIDVKGVELLIEALSVMYLYSYTFLFIGDGPKLNYYKNKVNATHLCRHSSVFVGHQDNVAKYLSISDIYVLPSETEGFSYTVMEAAIMKVPIIVSDIGVIPNDCAQILRERTADEIINQLIFMDKNPYIIKKNVDNAYKYATQFTMKDYINNVIEVCQTELNQKKDVNNFYCSGNPHEM